MDDLISRQATIDTVVAWTVEDRPDIEMPTDLIDRIKNMPSAQPEQGCDECIFKPFKQFQTERKKGEWERKSFYDSTPICSECGIEGRWDFEYCPYCGAEMEGEEHETDRC